MKKLFLSTALPYVNSLPHCGFALEIIQADVTARYHRLLGEDVFFLTGTDENSLKNVRAAEKEGMPVKEFVDRNAQNFYNLKKALSLSFDDFIRTTEERHIRGAQKLWQACRNDIYKKKYRGLYCVGCEQFYKESELLDGCCPEHRTKPELVEEENYFFRLSKYQDQIKKLIEEDKVQIIPETRKNEMLSFISQGLEDICISRSVERAKGWGIDVPGDPSQKIWCWIDALGNYITALGYAKESKEFQEFWQRNPNKIHMIGKGIVRFHAVYWVGILLAAKLSLPKTIFVHGYITSNGQKMSKSLGNVIDPFDLVDKYGVDAVRYFLLREFSSTEDGDFAYNRLDARYNDDLAHGLGNLVSRVLAMSEKWSNELEIKPNPGFEDKINQTWKDCRKALEEFNFNQALVVVWKLMSFCDEYIAKERPWEEKVGHKEVLGYLVYAIAHLALMLIPFLPQTADKIFTQLGIDSTDIKTFQDFETTLKKGKLRLSKAKPLFPRLD